MGSPSAKSEMPCRWIIALLAVTTATSARAQPVEGPPPAEAQAQAAVNVDSIVDQVIQRVTGPEVEKIVRGTVRRARRALAIGPTVGGWAAYVPTPEVYEQAVTFGLGLEVFKIPIIPGLTTFKALVEERVKAKLKQQIIDRFKGVPPEPIELDRIAMEIFEEVKAEILGERDVRGKTMERPRFSLALEANRLFEAEAWMARTRVGIGIWKFTLAGSFAVAFGDDTTAFAGFELATHFLLSKGVRTPVVDVFLRADFKLNDREANGDHVGIGARFLLDLI
jgi:hypothetical protein